MRALVRCVLCDSRKYESEVFYSVELKDFICRDIISCKKREELYDGGTRKSPRRTKMRTMQ